MIDGTISRPGISSQFLARHNIRHVEDFQAEELIGFKAPPGVWIPYPGLCSTQMLIGDRPFGRLRLDRPNGAKYLSPRGSGAQIFIPQGPPFGKQLVVVEGEFKAMSLCEAGIRAVGIGGITSAMHDGEILPDLWRILKKHPIGTLLFLGDSDTVFLFDFSREATKLARAIPEGCTLKLPRIPLSMPKGIDDVKGSMGGDAFMDFWQKIAAAAITVSRKSDPSSLAVQLLATEWPTIAKAKDEYEPQLVTLGSNLRTSSALDELARKVKEHIGTNTSAFKEDSNRRNYEDANERPLPHFYFDGVLYFRPYRDGFEKLSREDASLALRSLGFRHRTASNCELSPCEVALHRLQLENRVDYAGPLCGRPPGFWREATTRVLCTRGPRIISAKEGDASAIEKLLCSLLGQDRDSCFDVQLLTLCAWIARARCALKNPTQHLPGQALALVGPRDCGKSLLQSLITHMLGGREADPSLWLVKGNDFNGDMWEAEHLRLGDEELAEDNRDRHGLRERLKKMVVADLYPLHAKHREAKSFRPIWRVTISGNDDGAAVAVLPPPSDSFADKIIYLRCFSPIERYHDGSEEAAKEFWQRLVGGVPAFLYQIENTPPPDELRESRFYVREFHHPEVMELISGASSVTPLGELITKWLNETGGLIEDSASEIFDRLRLWHHGNSGKISDYSQSARHFGHQLSRLSELPSWKGRISKGERYAGASRWKQATWKITSA